MLGGILGTSLQRTVEPKPAYLAGLPECELSQGMLWSQDAEVDESTAHGDVKVEREEFALHEAEGMSGKVSEKQEACGVQGTTRLLGHFQVPLSFLSPPWVPMMSRWRVPT